MYLAFYIGKKSENPDTTFFDRLVCFVTGSRYSHVEYVYDYNPATRIGKCWASSPRDGGVRRALIALKPEHWDVYKWTGPLPDSLGDGSVEDIFAWFTPKEGMKYDWIGAVATIVRLLKQSETKYFCSEILAEMFGFLKPYLFTPRKLFEALSDHLRKIVT